MPSSSKIIKRLVSSASDWVPRISVVTATSETGKACVSELVQRGHAESLIRACCRSEPKQLQITSAYCGIDCIAGIDAANPQTLVPCFEKADAAVIVTPYDPTRGFESDAQLTINMIEAALEADVQRIIHIGSWTVHEPERVSEISQRFIASESYLRDVVKDQAEWTVLRGGYFMRNLVLMFGQSLAESNTIKFPDVRYPIVDTRDIGRAAAALCLEPTNKYHGKFLECSGPEMISPLTVASVLSDILKRSISFEKTSVEDWERANPAVPSAVKQVVRFMAEHKEEAIPFAPQHLKQLLGENPTALERWVKDHRALFP